MWVTSSWSFRGLIGIVRLFTSRFWSSSIWSWRRHGLGAGSFCCRIVQLTRRSRTYIKLQWTQACGMIFYLMSCTCLECSWLSWSAPWKYYRSSGLTTSSPLSSKSLSRPKSPNTLMIDLSLNVLIFYFFIWNVFLIWKCICLVYVLV